VIEFRGAGGAPGIAIGPIVCYQPIVTSNAAPFSVRRERAVAYLKALSARLREKGMPDEAAIFDAQVLLVADPALEAVVVAHEQAGAPVAEAIRAAIDELAAPLESLDDPYLRERAADVRATGVALLGDERPVQLPPGAILLAPALTPAETVNLPLQSIGGLGTAQGSATSHTAILARSLGIPAVLGLGPEALAWPEGTRAILDGEAGVLILEPDMATQARYEQLQLEHRAALANRAGLRELPAETSDGRRIALWANIGGLAEVDAAIKAGAEGIGLLRTEFLFLQRSAPPSEDEQVDAYAAVLHRMAGRPVVVRTLDVGGDKPLPYLPALSEPNPFLGERGIRFSQHFPDLFRTQLRALLRAATQGDLRIMLPMVATTADLEWAHDQMQGVADDLRAAGINFRAEVPLGIMVETPAAALMADRLASKAAFFSVGSNDLAQYTLAADRTLARLAGRYNGDEPAVYRLIAMTIAGARTAGIAVGICGELAADPEAAVALLGLGVDELSMAPSSIGAVKERIRATTFADAQDAGRRACGR
jgi:phosphoenolpyruvate-protein phosphotransferase